MAVGDFAGSGCCLRGKPANLVGEFAGPAGKEGPEWTDLARRYQGATDSSSIRIPSSMAPANAARARHITTTAAATAPPTDSRYPSNDKAAPGPAAGQADRDHDRPCTLEAELRQEAREGPLDQVAGWQARTAAGAVTSTAGLGAGPRSRLASRTPRARRPPVAARPGPPRGRSPGPSGRRRRCLPRDPPTRSCRSDRVTLPRCELNRGSGSGKVSGPGVACSTL